MAFFKKNKLLTRFIILLLFVIVWSFRPKWFSDKYPLIDDTVAIISLLSLIGVIVLLFVIIIRNLKKIKNDPELQVKPKAIEEKLKEKADRKYKIRLLLSCVPIILVVFILVIYFKDIIVGPNFWLIYLLLFLILPALLYPLLIFRFARVKKIKWLLWLFLINILLSTLVFVVWVQNVVNFILVIFAVIDVEIWLYFEKKNQQKEMLN